MSAVWKGLSRAASPCARIRGLQGFFSGFHSSALCGNAISNPYDENDDVVSAPSEKVRRIVEDIASLTLLEAADMSVLLKKRLKMQNVPVMSMGMHVMPDMWYDAALPPTLGAKRVFPEEHVIRGRKVSVDHSEAVIQSAVRAKSNQVSYESASDETDVFVENNEDDDDDTEIEAEEESSAKVRNAYYTSCFESSESEVKAKAVKKNAVSPATEADLKVAAPAQEGKATKKKPAQKAEMPTTPPAPKTKARARSSSATKKPLREGALPAIAKSKISDAAEENVATEADEKTCAKL